MICNYTPKKSYSKINFLCTVIDEKSEGTVETLREENQRIISETSYIYMK